MSAESRALEIAKAAIAKVFTKGGETTVTLPKFWSMHISVSRTIRDATELEVRLVNILSEKYEGIILKRLTSVIMGVREPYFMNAIVIEGAIVSVIVHGRFKLSVRYLTGAEGVVTADISIKKV